MSPQAPPDASRELWERLYGHPLMEEDLEEISENLGRFLALLYAWSLNPPVEVTPRPAAGGGRVGGRGPDPLTWREKGATLLTELYRKGVSCEQSRASHGPHPAHRGDSQARPHSRRRGGHGHPALGRGVDRARTRKASK